MTKSDVIDPHNLQINLWINGEIKQTDNTGNMHFKIDEQLEFITKYVTLYPGDLVLTGTPHGIGHISIGDKIRANLIQNDTTLVELKFNVEAEKEASLI